MVKIVFIILSITLISSFAKAQSESPLPFYIEFRIAPQSSFGPSASQAEIAGGVDTISYDHKKHFIPGFKSSIAPELVAGYRQNQICIESTVSYITQDIGLIHKIYSKIEYPFVMSEMLSVKVSALLHLSNIEKRGSYGLFAGIFLSTVLPVSYKMNDQTMRDFGLNDFRPKTQFNWGMDYKYIFRLGNKGAYVSTGASVTMPGIAGSIGKLAVQPGSSYEVVRDKIQMFTIKAFLGVGFRLGKCK